MSSMRGWLWPGSLRVPYVEARILAQMGLLERQRGDPEGARERLEGALGIFQTLGAAKDVEQTQALAGTL